MNIISVFDLSREEIEWIIEKAWKLKKERMEGIRGRKELAGKTLAMIFEKPSTRTRVSFDVAMKELGGNVISLNWNELQLGRGESIKESAKVFSSYVDAIMIRAYRHDTVEEFAKHASIPVINGLSDLEHPCQTLADFMTIKEHKKSFSGVKVAWIGDGNNVCNSLIGGCAIMGMSISVACAKSYEPDQLLLEKAKEMGCKVLISRKPREAASDADVMNTNTSVIFEQAENRLHTEKALLLKLLI
jgi:ornithine carbamoyltransferase